jgi:copper chaperone CopZ
LKSAPNTGPRHRRDERARAPGELERSVLFNWLHGLAKNTGPYYLGVQARVTSGIGNVDVYQPNYIALVGGESVGATGTCGCRKLVRTGNLRLCPSGGHGVIEFRTCAIYPNAPVADALCSWRDGLTGRFGNRTVSQYSWLSRLAGFVGASASSGRVDGIATNQITSARKRLLSMPDEFSAPTGHGPGGSATSTERTMTDATMAVHGMSCDACQTAVEAAVRAVPGVWRADVELQSGSLHVEFDPPADTDAIRAAVEDQGYEVAGE